jgi:predicted amidohydrolase YtcJ
MLTTAFINGKIFTSNLEQPIVNAMVVQDGKIIWMGDQSELDKIDGKSIDLKGRRVLPGLIDAHLHPLYLANSAKQIACTAPNVLSIAGLKEKITKLRSAQSPDLWIEGWGYDEGKLLEGRSPTRWDLDEAAADIPVIITRTCGHIIAVNSRVLELAGITKDTPDPQGGKIDRDKNGEPTGILRENAKDLVTNIMPSKTMEENAELLAELSPFLLSKGITAISELMGKAEPADYYEMYNLAVEKGLKQRTVIHYEWEDLKGQTILTSENTNNQRQVYIGGIKLFADGSVSGQTAWVNPPFLGDGENYGIQMTTKEELLAAKEAAVENKVQLVVHAMGEQAIDLIIDTFYGTEGWLKDTPSIRIEHAAMPTPLALQRAAETGIAFVTQPIFLFAEIESYLKNLGAERTKLTYPVQSMLQAGVKVAFSSDAPATAWADPVNPFVGLRSAVTRKAYDGTDTGQDQKVDIETAITLYTRAAQEISGVPNIGQLAPGYQADFIVLEQDILEMNPERIDEIIVQETYMDGQIVFQREGAPTK